MRHSIRPLSLLLAIATLPSPAARADTKPTPGSPRPNIIFLLTDDQDMAIAGPEVMPNLDRLVRKQGAELEDFYVQLSECCPSRATILTGLPNHETKIYHNGINDAGGRQGRSYYGGFPFFAFQGLEKDTLGTRFQDGGYFTAFVGTKYLNQYPFVLPDGPNGERVRDNAYVPPGWSYWSVMAAGMSPEGFDQRFISKIEDGETVYDPPGTFPKNPPSHSNFVEDVLFRKSVEALELALARKKPFFLHLSVLAPHHPSPVAPRHADCLKQGWKAPRTPNFDEPDLRDKASPQQVPRMKASTILATDEEFAKRLCSMKAIDDGIATLIAKLEASGQLANTYFIFNSDNGFHLGNHRFRTGKRMPYEEDIRVPFIARGPGIAAGTSLPGLASNGDIARTLLDLADLEPAPFMEGRSFERDLLGRGSALASRQALILERTETAVPPGFPNSTNGECAVHPPYTYKSRRDHADARRDHLGLRTRRFTYVRWCEGEIELYDNEADPFQVESLVSRPARRPRDRPYQPPKKVNPAFLEELEARLQALRSCKGAAACAALEDAPFVAAPYLQGPPAPPGERKVRAP
ncbi:MAG: sulfatase [Deltaproteobacteria bacterium]|nr:sulfatase [Deltaproteobacteria bacterium]